MKNNRKKWLHDILAITRLCVIFVAVFGLGFVRVIHILIITGREILIIVTYVAIVDLDRVAHGVPLAFFVQDLLLQIGCKIYAYIEISAS
jgi:hypothetical protein